MSFREIDAIEAENTAWIITETNRDYNSTEGRKAFKSREDIAREEQNPPDNTKVLIPDIYGPHPTLAQETEEEYSYRFRQIAYERSGSFAGNKALAKSINDLANQNFSNKILAATCDFKEMAENHPRSVFIQKFGPLIEEELKADPTKPSKRLAAFVMTYFWAEGNMQRMGRAVPPETTREELLEFFTLVPNSEPNKTMADFLPDHVLGEIVYATEAPENKKIKFDFRANLPSVSLEKTEELEKSITELAKQNFTNRLLTSTFFFKDIMNPFNKIRSIKEFGPAIQQELQADPHKPSQTLVSILTERSLREEDVKLIKDRITPETTKEELAEFLTAREKWSTGLRMIDYLNHHVVMEMARFLPDRDKLDLWALRPELINGFHAGHSLKKLSPEYQEKVLDTVTDPVRKEAIREEIDSELIGFRTSVNYMGVDSGDPMLLDIPAQFSQIRKRRICSHDDNRRFFHAHENYRSSY